MAAIEANAPQNADADSAVAAKAAESEVKLDWKAQKEEQARLRKKENDLKKCEEKIAALEARLSEIDTEMSDPSIGPTGTSGAGSKKFSANAFPSNSFLTSIVPPDESSKANTKVP